MTRYLALITLFAICPSESFGQQEALPVGGVAHVDASARVGLSSGHVSQTRLQVRDLGIAPYDMIPPGQSAITSLTVGPRGNIYGGTSGEVANLIVFSREHNFVFPLGTIPGEEGIYHALVAGPDGRIYAGTTLNPFREYHPRVADMVGPDSFYRSVTEQIEADFASYAGGHIYAYDPTSTRVSFRQERFRIGRPCPLESLTAC